jgi:hypothetical protein
VLDADANAPNIPASLANLADGLVQLFDDGSSGDPTAGDGVYSWLVTASGALTHDGGTHQQLDAELFFFEGLATGVRINVIGGLAVADAAQRGRFPTQTLGAGLTATTHAAFWVDDGTIYPNYPVVDARGAVDVCEGCQILIEEFGDIFDFVTLQSIDVLEDVPDCGCLASFVSTQNDVEGIGSQTFNNNGGPFVLGGTSFNTFSDGKLEGIIWSNQIDRAPLSHEVMHPWAARAASTLGWMGRGISRSSRR